MYVLCLYSNNKYLALFEELQIFSSSAVHHQAEAKCSDDGLNA